MNNKDHFLYGIAAAMICAETGPGGAICGIAGGAICGLVFGLLTHASLQGVIDDIHWAMDKLGCSCAIYCS